MYHIKVVVRACYGAYFFASVLTIESQMFFREICMMLLFRKSEQLSVELLILLSENKPEIEAKPVIFNCYVIIFSNCN